MKPRDSQAKVPQENLFQARLDQQLDPKHPLFRLAQQIDWNYFEQEFGAFYSEEMGRPGAPTRLLVGLHYLKHTVSFRQQCMIVPENHALLPKASPDAGSANFAAMSRNHLSIAQLSHSSRVLRLRPKQFVQGRQHFLAVCACPTAAKEGRINTMKISERGNIGVSFWHQFRQQR